MGLSAPSKLYFAAALLFVATAAIGYWDTGLELKTGLGLIMACVMVRLGIKAGRAGRTRVRPRRKARRLPRHPHRFPRSAGPDGG
jgi:hypothetical protein